MPSVSRQYIHLLNIGGETDKSVYPHLEKILKKLKLTETVNLTVSSEPARTGHSSVDLRTVTSIL